ncbi:MAG: inverse autotransporter beta domain-containing protein [Verrucomicrobia bacterium]|nr:inverse autotransporter beta domain-containing protein [Verrucomicrobiota bacterium]
MRAIPLSLIAAALIPAFTASSFAGSSAPVGKNPVSTADSAWSSTILGFGVKTNDNYTDGNVFLTVPLISTIGRDGKLGGDYLFIEPYSSVGTGGEVAASLGLAWRHLFSNQSVAALHNKGEASFMEEGWFLGTNLFVDMLDTQHNNQFWQLGVGAEIGNRYLQLSGNYYIPLSDRELAQRNVSTQSFSNTSNSTQLTSAGDPFATGHEILQNATYTTYASTTTTTVRTVSEIFEQGMEGWDAQLAVLVPWLDQWVDLKLIGGYFSFDNQPFGPQKFGTGNVHGWKAGAEFRPVPAVVLSAMWYQDARLTGNDWTVGVQLQVPLGKDWKDSFRPRRRHLVEDLAEPVHRQNDAVKIGNDEEHHSTTSVKHVTRVVKKTDTQIVLKDDIIFVNNGPAVGNGIQAGNEQTGDGTAEKPKAIIQSGADIAQANSNSTGRVWNVYTQGSDIANLNRNRVPKIAQQGPGIGYTENIIADVGSVNFIGSGKLIPGVGGKSFGTGPAPVVNGGFYADEIPFFGVTGYTINLGISSGHGSGDGIHVHVADGGIVNIVSNIINDVDFDAIYLDASTGSVPSSITIAQNTINTSGSYGIHLDTDNSALVKLIVSNNTLTNAGLDGSDGIAIHAGSTAPLTASFVNNTITGSGNDGINIESQTDGTTLNLAFTGNKFLNNGGDGVDLDTDAINVNWNFNFTGNTFTDNQDNNLDLELESTIGQVLMGNITGNTFTGSSSDNLTIDLGTSSSYKGTISGNTFTDSGFNGIHIHADGTGAGTGTVIETTISGNTFHTASGNYILTEAKGTSTATVVQTNNTFNSAFFDAMHADSSDTATLNFTATGNTITDQTVNGIGLQAYDGSTLNATITNNTITGGINAITAINVSSVDIVGNTIRDSISRGIFITSNGTVETEATVINNTMIKAGQNSLEVVSEGSANINLTVTSNFIDQATSRGVILDNRDTSTIDVKFNLNTITGSAIDGLYLSKLGTTLNVTGTLNNLIGPHPGGLRVNFSGTSPTVSFLVNGVLITTPTNVP